MSIKLRDLIRNIRGCKTAAEERAVVSKECALIRTNFKEEDNEHRHRNVAKLLFINMLGYSTSFGQLECLKLIASNKFSAKRVGYLGLVLLLDENCDVLMLVTNSIKNDLNHPNQYVNGLALCALGNIATPEMCRALAREVEELMSVSNPYVRKKAALCAMRMIRKVEEIDDKFNTCLVSMLDDKNHGVILSAISAVLALLDVNHKYASYFTKHVPQLVKLLRNLSTSGGSNASEYDIGGITDPFLQVKILVLLAKLAKENYEVVDEMSDVLAQVATNTESGKTVGNAILYECARTIVFVQPLFTHRNRRKQNIQSNAHNEDNNDNDNDDDNDDDCENKNNKKKHNNDNKVIHRNNEKNPDEFDETLTVLATNILCKFLQHRDNNIRYVALSTLQHVVKFDSKVVQRHRSTIVECLKDLDISIRRRALDVTLALTNEENIKAMTKELLNFLLVADIEFKADLVMKICMTVEKYSSNKKWEIDTIIKVMCLAGNYIQDNIRDSFIQTIAACNNNDLYTYTVHKLYFSVKENMTQETLVQTAVWCIGEYGDLLIHPDKAKGLDDMPINVSSNDVINLIEALTKKSNVCSYPSAAPLNLGSFAPSSTSSSFSSSLSTFSSSNLSSSFLRNQTTLQFIVTCLLKLTTRMPNEAKRIKKMIIKYQKSMCMEIQQRACEYEELLMEEWEGSRPAILDRMPVINVTNEKKLSKYNALNNNKLNAKNKTSNDYENDELLNGDNQKFSNKEESPNKRVDLLDFDDLLDLGEEEKEKKNDKKLTIENGFSPSTTKISSSINNNNMNVLDNLLGSLSVSDYSSETVKLCNAASSDSLLIGSDYPDKKTASNKIISDNLLDSIFDSGTGLTVFPSATSPPPATLIPSTTSPSSSSSSSSSFSIFSDPISPSSACTFPSIVAFKNEKIKVEFSFTKKKKDIQEFNIIAKYINLTDSIITGFNVEVAVPKHFGLEMKSASSNILEAFGMNEIIQVIKIMKLFRNEEEKKKAFLMKIRITYNLNGTSILESANVSNFPSGL